MKLIGSEIKIKPNGKSILSEVQDEPSKGFMQPRLKWRVSLNTKLREFLPPREGLQRKAHSEDDRRETQRGLAAESPTRRGTPKINCELKITKYGTKLLYTTIFWK